MIAVLTPFSATIIPRDSALHDGEGEGGASHFQGCGTYAQQNMHRQRGRIHPLAENSLTIAEHTTTCSAAYRSRATITSCLSSQSLPQVPSEQCFHARLRASRQRGEV
jgi:hypothetical protein